MSRMLAISKLSDEQVSPSERERACLSLADLLPSEPEFKSALDALFVVARSHSVLRDVADFILRALNERRSSEAHRKWIQSLIAALPDGVSADTGRLVSMLADRSVPWQQRDAACGLLGELDPPGAVSALLGTFADDDDVELASQAANALFQIRVETGRRLEEATSHLMKAFTSSQSLDMRKVVLYALGRLADPQAQPMLLTILDDRVSAPELREEALRALAFQPPSALKNDRFVKALEDPDASIRMAAVGLVDASLPGVMDSLRKLLDDHSVVPRMGTVAECARWRLGRW